MKIYSLDKIETPRLIIRPIKMGDEIELNQALNRSLFSVQRWMPWAKDPSLEATLKYVKASVKNWQFQTSNDFSMVVIHKEDNRIIAGSGYNDQSMPMKLYYEIGYWLDEPYRGRGLVTEFVNGLTRYALEALQAKRVQIAAQVENTKSINVAKRLGYTCELIKRHDRLDCITNKPADTILFSCCDTEALPKLEVTWQHTKKHRVRELQKSEEEKNNDGHPLPILETQRLKLIPPRLQDSEALHDAIMHSLPELSPWFSWAKPSLTEDDLKTHIMEAVSASEDMKNHDHLFFCVWNKTDNQFLGEVWLKVRNGSVPYFTISYWFDSRSGGHGYATEALSGLIDFAFLSMKANRIELDISEKNAKSLRLADRLGFVYEGDLNNHVRNFVTGEILASKLFSLTDYSQFTNHRAIMSWVKETLHLTEGQIYHDINMIVKTPWSSVLKFNAPNLSIYLKQTPRSLFLEAEIIKTLRDRFKMLDIPDLIAENKELSCFLMKDCGDINLRDYFRGDFQGEIFNKGLSTYKTMIKATMGHADEFIALGVPDWRLDKFPELYLRLPDIVWLKSIGLDENDQMKLNQFSAEVSRLCKQLSTYSIAECLTHSDFHDGNMLYKLSTSEVSIVDLGETAISNPLFSLAACFNDVITRYKIEKNSENFKVLEHSMFDGWLDSDESLREVLKIINKLLPIYLIFAHLRLVQAICPIELGKNPRMNNRLKNAFSWFFENMENTSIG